MFGAKPYPGSEVAICIDNAPAVKYEWTGGTVTGTAVQFQLKVIPQLLSGKTYLARSYDWPGHDEKIIEGSLDGFKEAYEWALQAVRAYPARPLMPTVEVDANDETPTGLPLHP